MVANSENQPSSQSSSLDVGPEHAIENRIKIRMDDPQIATAVDNLLVMAPDLAGAAKLLIGFVQRSSQIAENVNGIVDTARQAATGQDGRAGAGIADVPQFIAKAERLAKLVDQLEPLLSKPETIASLQSLVAALPKLMTMLKLFEMFLGRSSDMAENFNGVVDTFREAINKKWPTSEERARIARIPAQLMETVESPALHRLLHSKVLSDEALTVMNHLASCVIDADRKVRDTNSTVGPLGLLKALREPEVQRGMAEAIEIARLFGGRTPQPIGAAPGNASTSGGPARA
jgi:uncharacterized protein YjgD (DUF1641 family)